MTPLLDARHRSANGFKNGVLVVALFTAYRPTRSTTFRLLSITSRTSCQVHACECMLATVVQPS